jgi:hypothetical protein
VRPLARGGHAVQAAVAETVGCFAGQSACRDGERAVAGEPALERAQPVDFSERARGVEAVRVAVRVRDGDLQLRVPVA